MLSLLFNGITVSALFIVRERSGCFATSDQPIVGVVRAIGAYHLGVRLGPWRVFDY